MWRSGDRPPERSSEALSEGKGVEIKGLNSERILCVSVAEQQQDEVLPVLVVGTDN